MIKPIDSSKFTPINREESSAGDPLKGLYNIFPKELPDTSASKPATVKSADPLAHTIVAKAMLEVLQQLGKTP